MLFLPVDGRVKSTLDLGNVVVQVVPENMAVWFVG